MAAETIEETDEQVLRRVVAQVRKRLSQRGADADAKGRPGRVVLGREEYAAIRRLWLNAGNSQMRFVIEGLPVVEGSMERGCMVKPKEKLYEAPRGRRAGFENDSELVRARRRAVRRAAAQQRERGPQ